MLGQCERLTAVLADGSGDAGLDADVIAHAGTCLTCQAALARHHRLLRVLGELRNDAVAMPPSLLTDVLDAVGRAATRSVVRATVSRHRVVSIVGLAGAAVLVALVVMAERFRPAVRRGHRREFEAR